jgi:hypothetical protein
MPLLLWALLRFSALGFGVRDVDQPLARWITGSFLSTHPDYFFRESRRFLWYRLYVSFISISRAERRPMELSASDRFVDGATIPHKPVL